MPSIKLGTMTISVSKNMLLAKLQQLSRIIPSKSTTPIVCNYLFEIKDGRLFITTANDEGGYRPVWNVWQRKIFQFVFLPPFLMG